MGTKFVFIRCGALKLLFNLIWGFARREPRPVGDPEDMRIDSDGGLSKRFVQNDIGGLPANPWQGHQCFARLGNLTIKIVQQHLRKRDHIFGLVAPEANRLDVFLDAFKTQTKHFLGRIGGCKEARGRLVDPNICGLGREGDSHNKRIRRGERQLGVRVRAVLGERGIKGSRLLLVEDRAGAFLFAGCSCQSMILFTCVVKSEIGAAQGHIAALNPGYIFHP